MKHQNIKEADIYPECICVCVCVHVFTVYMIAEFFDPNTPTNTVHTHTHTHARCLSSQVLATCRDGGKQAEEGEWLVSHAVRSDATEVQQRRHQGPEAQPDAHICTHGYEQTERDGSRTDNTVCRKQRGKRGRNDVTARKLHAAMHNKADIMEL